MVTSNFGNASVKQPFVVSFLDVVFSQYFIQDEMIQPTWNITRPELLILWPPEGYRGLIWSCQSL